MLFMVIETFEDADMRPTYRRLAAAGRGMPEGLRYVDSWVEAGMRRCFQLMECHDAALLQEWAFHWRDCGVTFDIVPVVPASRTRDIVTASLSP
jgi:hypothetical protein